nr:RNA-binding transcriptional accessory protein [Gammaproteobacteria bacterium]
MDISLRIAEELNVRPRQIEAAVDLLDGGASVPFIARYRKEMTGGLDDQQLRRLEERLPYLRELEERRETVLNSIDGQGKLTPELKQVILNADTKTQLEDLYAPYRPKRRNRATLAREAGLEPLADALIADPTLDPHVEAAKYVQAHTHPEAAPGVADAAAALEGARHILMERIALEAMLLGRLREIAWERGRLRAAVVSDKAAVGAKFKDYFDYAEAIKGIPSHRALALLRGRNEGILHLSLQIGDDQEAGDRYCEAVVAKQFHIRDAGRAADGWLQDTVRIAWRTKLFPRIDVDLKLRLREAAEQHAVQVFAGNLKDLLLAAPAGARAAMGLDPGLRTGVKVAVVDTTGKLLETAVIYPHAPKQQWTQAIAQLATLAERHRVELVSIGNGTASRETQRLVADLIRSHAQLKLVGVLVSEAGASVYSASEAASEELPSVDVSLRGAVSIARRLQDPLAELVKIDPKAIGVGQYQHDVHQGHLARSLDAVVEDCVNAVGVDVNTASPTLLKHVSGLNPTLARNIVAYRDQHGRFRSREQLKQVPRLGAKSFEQAAGFLRIVGGGNPLDASAVHPEAYAVVERIKAKTGRGLETLIGDEKFLRSLKPERFTDQNFGVPTVTDILAELEKPGRDPRPEFRSARFKEGVEKLEDLQPEMVLEGVVTNVTSFGAFVDIGVHQDGLVHVSMLADHFVKDPRQVVKAGDIVQVHVVEIDLERRRVALSMRGASVPQVEKKSAQPAARTTARDALRRSPKSVAREARLPPQTAMAEALAQALKRH